MILYSPENALKFSTIDFDNNCYNLLTSLLSGNVQANLNLFEFCLISVIIILHHGVTCIVTTRESAIVAYMKYSE